MDLVAGRKNQGTVDGDMLFDGKPRPSYFKRVAGYVWSTAPQRLHSCTPALRLHSDEGLNIACNCSYVEQNDVLIPTLTVRETLLYAAELRLPADQYTTQEKAERVDQIIETLGLTHCADTQV
jgi:ABC-type multidrug transport system ATPase subunit